jgi:hypothetical protein
LKICGFSSQHSDSNANALWVVRGAEEKGMPRSRLK